MEIRATTLMTTRRCAMPIYEYLCSNCNEITEAWQKFSDPPLSVCSKCGGELKKLISLNSFHLKGSGWYVTDYASKGKSTEKSKEGESSSSESSSQKKESGEK
ncbi:MAG: FmdB family zinc ribbon protein [Desulfatiglandales bacterium]